MSPKEREARRKINAEKMLEKHLDGNLRAMITSDPSLKGRMEVKKFREEGRIGATITIREPNSDAFIQYLVCFAQSKIGEKPWLRWKVCGVRGHRIAA